MASVRLAPRLTPEGRLHLDALAADGAGAETAAIDPAVAARLVAAFADGTGAGLLHLGAAEAATALPPALAFFRDLGRRFVSSLCGLPDLEAARGKAAVPPPPEDELSRLAAAAPPLVGGEYLDGATLAALWEATGAAFRDAIAGFGGPVETWLRQRDPAWNLVGRVCFHLAENRSDPARPFAFLATYTTRLSAQAKPQHRPLGEALREYAGDGNRAALLALLGPVDRAARRSALIREMVDDRQIFHPLAWTPRQAHRFLAEVSLLEESGVVVRVPDWWKPRRPLRPEVHVTVGERAPGGLGLSALLDFSVAVTVDGEPIGDEEWRALLASTEPLVAIRGRWVEVDREKLAEVLDHWKRVEREAKQGGITFLEGMRLLAGARVEAKGGDGDDGGAADWSAVHAGAWLAETLDGLRGNRLDPSAIPEALGPSLRATLRPYQAAGVAWLHLLQRLGLGACLADDMGLGKTIQVLALLLALRRDGRRPPHLLVVPASLIGNWQAEIERFAPALRALIAHPSALPPAELKTLPPSRLDGVDLVITTYGSLHRLPWLAETTFDLAILDEAQAVKNPGTRQTRAAKALRARTRVALTGTPVENRLGDLWSLFDFLNPGLLGSAKVFGEFARRLGAGPAPDWTPLRDLVRPYILRRLKTDRTVVADLPEKTEMRAFCALTPRQAALYQQSVEALAAELDDADGMKRRGVILAFLLRMKQICNHPSHWLGDGPWASGESGKFARLGEIAETVAARQEKLLVFTQFREATEPLSAFLAAAFGRPGLVLHGQTPVRARKALVDRFQSDEDVPFFVLSVKAGGTGLNLTAASHVVHFDRWWNPAVEDQATDRAFRIGQRRNVLVHKFVCRGTVEEKIDAMIESKKGLARDLLAGGGEALVTEMGDRELLDLVALDIHRAVAEG